jgi:hypothetical protein
MASAMEKEHITGIAVQNTSDLGNKGKEMGMELFIIQMVLVKRGIGKMTI